MAVADFASVNNAVSVLAIFHNFNINGRYNSLLLFVIKFLDS